MCSFAGGGCSRLSSQCQPPSGPGGRTSCFSLPLPHDYGGSFSWVVSKLIPNILCKQPEKSPLPPPPPVSAAPQSPALDLNAEFSIAENGSDSQVCARPQPPFSTCFSHPRWQNHLAFNTAPTTAPNWDPAWCPPCTHCRGSEQELEVPWGHICHLLL